MPPSKSPPIANRLLAALPKKDYQTMLPYLEEIPLVFEEVLYQPNAVLSESISPTVALSLSSPVSTSAPP